jgi:hypothetical protein
LIGVFVHGTPTADSANLIGPGVLSFTTAQQIFRRMIHGVYEPNELGFGKRIEGRSAIWDGLGRLRMTLLLHGIL